MDDKYEFLRNLLYMAEELGLQSSALVDENGEVMGIIIGDKEFLELLNIENKGNIYH